MSRGLAVAALSAALAIAGCSDEQPPERPGATPLSCERPEVRHFRIDEITAPINADEAERLGFDFDDDGTVDNQAGNIMSAVFSAYAEDGALASWRTQLDARLVDQTVWLVEVSSCPDDDVRVALLEGELVDGEVRIVTVDPGVPAGGGIVGRSLFAGLGSGRAPIGALADLGGGTPDGFTPIDSVIVELVEDVPGELDGRLGFSLAPGYQPVIATSFAPYIDARLDAGQTEWGGQVDRNDDGDITVDELLADSLFDILTRPDLDALAIDDGSTVYWPEHDGQNDSLTMGVEIHATEIDR